MPGSSENEINLFRVGSNDFLYLYFFYGDIGQPIFGLFLLKLCWFYVCFYVEIADKMPITFANVIGSEILFVIKSKSENPFEAPAVDDQNL